MKGRAAVRRGEVGRLAKGLEGRLDAGRHSVLDEQLRVEVAVVKADPELRRFARLALLLDHQQAGGPTAGGAVVTGDGVGTDAAL